MNLPCPRPLLAPGGGPAAGRRLGGWRLGCFLGFSWGALAADTPPPRPNFLLILTDDRGYGDVSTYLASEMRTPPLDRLAAEGMLFTTMRANATVCSPSRAALLTGRYADRVGVPGGIRTRPQESWGYFDPSLPTLADELKQAGYHTALVGKRPLVLASPNTPNERGFETNTVVLFTADNGDSLPQAQSNHPWREGGAACGGKSYEALIRGDWKLLQNGPFSPLELYHLREDPQEKTNLAAVNRSRFNELAAALRAHIQRGGATPWQKPGAL